MREKRTLIIRNIKRCLGVLLASFCVASLPAHAQMYDQRDSRINQGYPVPAPPGQPQRQPNVQYHDPPQPPAAPTAPTANLQLEPRDAESILRDQLARQSQQFREQQRQDASQSSMYDNFYEHRISNPAQVSQVMAEARRISSFIKKRNGKAFVVIDKRNFQFYLFNRNSRLLRIGPVAIGKGRTDIGAFETHVGVYPIKRKQLVADWTRPNWYFLEENEPIPVRHADRIVPGFFRHKLVFSGARYIHYAEATGGRLTHGCLGLDWQDSEAVYHTLQVGSYCIVVDDRFLARLARGEFPIKQDPKRKKRVQGSFKNLW